VLLKLGRQRNTKLETPGGFAKIVHAVIAWLSKVDYYLLPDSVPGTSAIISIDFPNA